MREDLNLITEIPDTGISVTWELDNYKVMDIRGGLRQENLIEEGTLVKLTALLRYEEEKAACEFYARVFPPRMNSSEKMIQKIEEQIRKNDEETRTEEYLPLPDTVEWHGYTVGVYRKYKIFCNSDSGSRRSLYALHL